MKVCFEIEQRKWKTSGLAQSSGRNDNHTLPLWSSTKYGTRNQNPTEERVIGWLLELWSRRSDNDSESLIRQKRLLFQQSDLACASCPFRSPYAP